MCGIWGFECRGVPDVATLEAIVHKADERGGHAWGLYGVTIEGEHIMARGHGRASFNKIYQLVKRCRIAIGHSRLITSADRSLFNSQPVVVKGMAIAHNGNIENHKSVMASLGYNSTTDLDSEALVPIIRNRKPLPEMTAYLGIQFTDYEAKLIEGANGLPLIKKNINGNTYYCSKEWQRKY